MRSLLKFFLITFSATWILWFTSFALSQGMAAAHPTLGLIAGTVFLLGVFTPALVALALTYRAQGRAATQSLLGRIFKWDVGWRWYRFSLAYMPGVKRAVAVVHRVATGTWPRFGATPWYLMA